MIDKLGRKIEYLRLSVTQSCNLNCVYCKPVNKSAESEVLPVACEKLTPGELETVVRAMAALGIIKVRITGGEPLSRPDIIEIVKKISTIQGIVDLSMTTNGTQLPEFAYKLKDAGLMRLNISLDSLKPERFKLITGIPKLGRVLEGINIALEAGLSPVRINTVLIKGINDDEIADFMRLACDKPLEVRFIELMPIGSFGEQNLDKVVYNSDIINAHPELVRCEEEYSGQPAKYYNINGYRGKIGFISSLSHKFCSSCNRIRLTCDGKIKPCLGNNGEVDLLEVLRYDPGSLERVIKKAISEKPGGHNFGKDFSSARNMNMIGG
ncbi:MAG: GTP 3',8-cyclase MoaA [Ruminiclostridium sp.]|nr:GTP 3',8-cyclase MoaA [Ruminiclostridium sp.]